MKTAIVIVGPTAAGKTAAALSIAKHFQTEIISADSRQCYKELNIGVARPSPDELGAVPHHFIASHSIHEPINAGIYEQEALQRASRIFQEHDHLVVVGGTGLYIKAFCEGLDEIPPADADTRKQVAHGYELHGMEWLQNEIREKDPEFYSRGEIRNPQRVMRALEVVLATGRSILDYRNSGKKERNFQIKKYGILVPKEQLEKNIARRTDEMFRIGLEEEARSLQPFRELGPLQTVGYSEMFDFFDGNITREEAISQIKTHTWQYAKRQYTWFRKDKDVEWLEPGLIARHLNAGQ